MKLNSDTVPVSLNQMPTTSELEHEIIVATNIEDYFEKHSSHMLSRSLPEHLKMLPEQKGISRAIQEIVCKGRTGHNTPVFPKSKNEC